MMLLCRWAYSRQHATSPHYVMILFKRAEKIRTQCSAGKERKFEIKTLAKRATRAFKHTHTERERESHKHKRSTNAIKKSHATMYTQTHVQMQCIKSKPTKNECETCSQAAQNVLQPNTHISIIIRLIYPWQTILL